MEGSQQAAREGRIGVRPHAPGDEGAHGLVPLGLDKGRDAWLHVPGRYGPDQPAPLIVALHGAGGDGRSHLDHLRYLSDEHGILLLAPSSRGTTWDVIFGEYGADVMFIASALQETFRQYAVDSYRLAVEGFSDGASYALSIGLANGDLFTHVLAFSPGFMAPAVQTGAPRVFVSHGIQDQVLRIDVCSRRLVPRLERAGYDVRYEEFSGGHSVPEEVARDAIEWFLMDSPT